MVYQVKKIVHRENHVESGMVFFPKNNSVSFQFVRQNKRTHVCSLKMNIKSCWLLFVLGCNVSAEMIHQIVEEEQQVSLRCSHSVEGKLTWSREINGNTVDIFVVDGDREQRLNDPGRRYGSTADKSLNIFRVAVSDSGKYLCSNEPAVELTVIPSGTTTVSITEKSIVNLTCPDVGGSHVPTWTREIDGKQQQIRPHVSAVDKYLNIPDVQPGDSGLYYCDGKPAANLNVIKGDQTERASPYLWQMPVRVVILILYLILMISITVTTWRRVQQIQKQHTAETENHL
ncbi:uncharacterized protein LOC121913199 isoform X2 [Thunnus maccoyii]|uniref:uncharacterized protein LOC121913199 isoform X2 n=1 Tax=Thunnus maccoyii TaxID=8240 RepID=UPI001C4D0478|nr:uncharacterized protein LOC121913199 isoform X2 [Thunnus maccoyii]